VEIQGHHPEVGGHGGPLARLAPGLEIPRGCLGLLLNAVPYVGLGALALGRSAGSTGLLLACGSPLGLERLHLGSGQLLQDMEEEHGAQVLEDERVL
jgi:hypothetical protein